jgi:5-methylcytosine-specific restriction protein A
MAWRVVPLPRRWARLRAAVLKRDQYTCRLRYPGCRIRATEVDHIVPAALGGSDDLSNLAAVCTPCHRHKTAREANLSRTRQARTAERHPGLR